MAPPGERHGRAGALDHGSAELHQASLDGRQVDDVERQVGEADLAPGRRRRAERLRRGPAEQLDLHAVLVDHLAPQHHAGLDLEGVGDLVADVEALGHLETEALGVEAQGRLDVGDAEADVGHVHVRHGAHVVPTGRACRRRLGRPRRATRAARDAPTAPGPGTLPGVTIADETTSTDTPEQAEFRAEVQAFLAANAKPRQETSPWALNVHTSEAEAREAFERAAAGSAPSSTTASPGSPTRSSTAAGAGSRGGVDLPRGGRRLRRDLGFIAATMAMLLPTLMKHATDEQKAYYIPRMLSAEISVCPALQRARRRLRPGQPRLPGRPRRRRVRGHRPEGLELGGPVLQLGHAAHPHRTPTSPSTRASRSSWSTWTAPASRCGRSCSPPARRTSTRSSSARSASRSPTYRRDRRRLGAGPHGACRTSRPSSAAAGSTMSFFDKLLLLAERVRPRRRPGDPPGARRHLHPREGARATWASAS